MGQLVQQKSSVTIEPCLLHITVHEKSHKKRNLPNWVFLAVYFELNYQCQYQILQRKIKGWEESSHIMHDKDLQMQSLEFLESTAFYCLRICCKIKESRHWLLLFSSSGPDQWETDPSSAVNFTAGIKGLVSITPFQHLIQPLIQSIWIYNPIKKWHPND